MSQEGAAIPDPQKTSNLSPLAALFLGSAAAAVLATPLDALWMSQVFGVGRLRELSLFWLVARGLDKVGIDLYGALPPLANRAFALDWNAPFHSSLTFFFWAVLTNLLLAWCLALLLVPLVLLGQRKGRHAALPFEATQAGRGLLLAIPVLFFLLGVYRPIFLFHSTGTIHQPRTTLGGNALLAAALLGGILWAVCLALGRRAPGLRGLLRGLTYAGLGVIVLAGAGQVYAWARQPSQPAANPARPNILLISIDSLRADHLHCYGYPRATSPALDALAAQGARFQTVMAPTSWTLPSHITLLTSLPPVTHGVIDDWMRLTPGTISLAQVLWHAGYATAGFVAGPYLMAEYGFSRWFDHYDDYSVRQLLPNFPDAHRGTTAPAEVPHVTAWLEHWDRTDRQRPFFLFVHMWDVHYDYDPPPPYDSMFDPDYHGFVSGHNIERGVQVNPFMHRRDLDHVIALYDGEIRFNDSYLGQILDTLRRLGIADNTIVAVTADHGEEFFEHKHKGHRSTLYDEVLLVPLVLRYPARVPAGKVVENQVRLMDVAPTLLSLAGVPAPPDFGLPPPHGELTQLDLTPWLTATDASDPASLPAFGDLIRPGRQDGGALVRHDSLRTPNYKLIHHFDKDSYELYDLRADPGEQVNILESRPEVSRALIEQLAAWRQLRGSGPDHAEALGLSEQQKERLRSLGYLH